MWQLMICISFISLFLFLFAGRLNNTLLCLYQRIFLGIPKRKGHCAYSGCLLPELFSAGSRQVSELNQVTGFQRTSETSEKDHEIVRIYYAGADHLVCAVDY